ncbi:MAG: glycoside hydrolase family 88 protein [Bacteroidales bacterium]|nr:glycoside hydrolase family 88 protein [Bacteroidales bacterium]
MKYILLFFIVSIALVATIPACGQRQPKNKIDQKSELWSVRMAESEMVRFPSCWQVDFVKEKRWNYTPGLEGLAFTKLYEAYKDERFYQYAKGYADSLIDGKGQILTYNKSNYNIDYINPGKLLIYLFEKTGDKRYKIALDTLRSQIKTQPRTTEGGFWHKKIYPNQMWLDGLYMGAPFYAEYAKKFNEPDAFADVVNQFLLVAKHTYDPKTGLYRHGWDESKIQKWANPETGQSPHAWGRAMGWYAMAIVDVLDFLPENQPGREEILSILKNMVEKLSEIQDPKTGGWYQVLDRNGEGGNYIETSCTSMFSYSIFKAVRKGYIDKKYLKTATKAYHGLIKNFIVVDAKGLVNLTRVCGVAGLGGNPYRDGSFGYYINEMIRDNDPKGTGPFIMASLEYEQLAK